MSHFRPAAAEATSIRNRDKKKDERREKKMIQSDRCKGRYRCRYIDVYFVSKTM